MSEQVKITITKVLKVVDANYGQKRVAFTTQEYGDKVFSSFLKYADNLEGKTFYGSIEEKQVDGKTYYNFKPVFKKTGGFTDSDREKIEQIHSAVNLILTKLNGGSKESYPEPEFPEDTPDSPLDDSGNIPF